MVGAFRTEVAEAPVERSTPSKGATVIPFRHDGKSGPSSARPQAKPVEAHADVIPLVNFRPQIDWLSAAELLTLRGFFKAEELDDLGLGAAICEATTHDLQWRVAAEPSKIGHYVDLIKRYHRQRNLLGYTLTLWRIFWLLGTRAPDLRERLLEGGERLGRHPILAGLRRYQSGETTLRVLADELSLASEPVDEAACEDLPLVVMEEPEDADLPREAYAGVLESGLRTETEILAHVRQLIDQHAQEQAMDVLEAALMDDPTQEDLYPLLLDLYVRTRTSRRFTRFQQRILGGEPQPSLESIMRILDTGQRLVQAQAVAT
jgi:hypothetical protein